MANDLNTALRTIAEYPVTDLRNLDAVNMRHIAQAALTAPPDRDAMGRLIGEASGGEAPQRVMKYSSQRTHHRCGAPMPDVVYEIAPKAKPAEMGKAQIEAAAKVIAARFDYPWEHMPEQGRNSMRQHAKAVAAALTAAQPADGKGAGS